MRNKDGGIVVSIISLGTRWQVSVNFSPGDGARRIHWIRWKLRSEAGQNLIAGQNILSPLYFNFINLLLT
jgi:hypothetical protein